MIRAALPLALVSALALVACNDTDDDVVQAPAPGAQPEPVSENMAQTATTQAALTLGMTREQLEDADVLSSTLTDLGDVETLVLDPAGQVTHVVIELEGGGDDRMVSVPIGQVTSYKDDLGNVDLKTDLTSAQLEAMAPWTATDG